MNSNTSDKLADYAVIGLGSTGLSCVRHLVARGASVAVFDTRERPPNIDAVREIQPALKVYRGDFDATRLMACKTIVMSPGVDPAEPALCAARTAGIELIGDIELFSRSARAPIVAITGTNGKSTVTALVDKMLRAAGQQVRCGGNIGTPALELLGNGEPDVYVLEVSSFQLESTRSLAPRVAVLLNITADHLDRHGTLEHYADIKAGILERAACAVVNADDPLVRSRRFEGRRIEFSLGAPGPGRYGIGDSSAGKNLSGPGGPLLPVDDIVLEGRHNWSNALAAAAVATELGCPTSIQVEVLRTFTGLAHRAVTVANVGGVDYIDDSKATNPGAAIATVEGLLAERRGVVIAGGEPKGGSFTAFADALATHAHSVVLIGRAAPAIEHALQGRVTTVHATGMAAAVQAAAALASAGEAVILAPACASFDMYSDYGARGDAFAHAVHGLGTTA